MPVKHPNILLIMSDNHSADLLGCYGNDEIHTPYLDRLASQGLRFDNAYCVNAMCSPCRASVLTGLMPSQHGVHTWLDDRIMNQWPPSWNAVAEFETLPELLNANGYHTAMIGKYHLGVPFEPQNGFDHWVVFPLGHTRNFWNNTIIDNGNRYSYEGHAVDCFSEKAVEYIESRDPLSEQPFFLFLAYNAPYGHWPAIKGPARNRFFHLYEDTAMNSVPREGLSQASIERFLLRREASGGGIDYSVYLQIPNDLTSLRNYYSQMSMVDDGVGRVLAALREQGLEEDTLVIYTCDHGFSLGHNGFWGHGQATWPANGHRPAYHIPLLVRHTGQITPGQTSEMMVSQIDLFSTLLDYAGLKPPSTGASISSRNMALLLFGRSMPNEREGVFIEQEEMRAYRTHEWLYVSHFKGSHRFPLEDELYDLVRDPAEKRNLIGDRAFEEVARDLSVRITEFFERYSSPEFDLWQGGTTKSNTDKPWLWEDAWGPQWKPTF